MHNEDAELHGISEHAPAQPKSNPAILPGPRVLAALATILLVAVVGIAGWLFVGREDRPGKLNLARAQIISIDSQGGQNKVQSKPAQGQLWLSELLDTGFLYDANIPPGEKKILWQKMKKQRSASQTGCYDFTAESGRR